MNTEIKLKVSEIQRFCMHDGPGVRTTVFLKGCPLSCEWCHNPETQKKASELLFYPQKCIGCGACVDICSSRAHCIDKEHIIDRKKCVLCFECPKKCPTGALEVCGKDMSADKILRVVEKDRAFYGELGGVTLSGGEPFMQGNMTISFLKACKERGISTAVETCGYADSDIMLAATRCVDLFLWDIKDTDDERHKRYTGVSNNKILENLLAVNESGARIRIRCIIVNGVNTDDKHYESVAEVAGRINNLDGVELIPYHAYGGAKSVFIGKEENGKTEWIPTESQMEHAREILKKSGVLVI